MNQCFLIT